MSALMTFLGGSAFRAIWGVAESWLKARQEHKQEVELLRLQGELDAAAHERRQAEIRLQAELGVKTIAVQSEANLQLEDAKGFYAARGESETLTGIAWVDAFNRVIRPAAASIALLLWVVALNRAGFVMTDWDKELVSAILGFFFANRVLAMRGQRDN